MAARFSRPDRRVLRGDAACTRLVRRAGPSGGARHAGRSPAATVVYPRRDLLPVDGRHHLRQPRPALDLHDRRASGHPRRQRRGSGDAGSQAGQGDGGGRAGRQPLPCPRDRPGPARPGRAHRGDARQCPGRKAAATAHADHPGARVRGAGGGGAALDRGSAGDRGLAHHHRRHCALHPDVGVRAQHDDDDRAGRRDRLLAAGGHPIPRGAGAGRAAANRRGQHARDRGTRGDHLGAHRIRRLRRAAVHAADRNAECRDRRAHCGGRGGTTLDHPAPRPARGARAGDRPAEVARASAHVVPRAAGLGEVGPQPEPAPDPGAVATEAR